MLFLPVLLSAVSAASLILHFHGQAVLSTSLHFHWSTFLFYFHFHFHFYTLYVVCTSTFMAGSAQNHFGLPSVFHFPFLKTFTFTLCFHWSCSLSLSQPRNAYQHLGPSPVHCSTFTFISTFTPNFSFVSFVLSAFTFMANKYFSISFHQSTFT